MGRFDRPTCGDDDEVTGRQANDRIILRCDRFGAEWPRDDTPRCATCGAAELTMLPRIVTAGGRATVESIVGRHNVPACTVCDRQQIEAYAE